MRWLWEQSHVQAERHRLGGALIVPTRQHIFLCRRVLEDVWLVPVDEDAAVYFDEGMAAYDLGNLSPSG